VANKTNHWKLGLFVVVALVIALGAIIALGLRRLNRDGIPMVTYFDESVQGLDVGSPVKFRGVTIGTVQSITIAPDHLHVEVWMRLYTDELARMGFGPDDKRDPSLRPQLAAAGITGVKFVQFDNFPSDRYPEPLLEFAPPSEYYAPPSSRR
jgi:paraquat-inducible protein B